MQLPDNHFLPFKMRGTTCYFESRSPAVDELELCQTFKVSDEHHWNPTDEIFIATVGWGHSSPVCTSDVSDVCSPVCTSDVSDVCVSELQLHEVCVHEFDLLQNSPGQIIAQIRTSERHHGIDAKLLSLKWGIGLEKARDTIKHTIQYNIRSVILPLTRRYRTDLLSQRLRRLNTRFYTDTMFAKVGNSLRGNTCAQIFTDGNGAVFVYPMRSKSEAGTQLLNLIQQVGIPNEMHRDGAPEMSGNSYFNKVCREYRIRSTFTEPHSPW